MSFDFADVSLTGWVLAGALAALGVVLLVIARGTSAGPPACWPMPPCAWRWPSC